MEVRVEVHQIYLHLRLQLESQVADNSKKQTRTSFVLVDSIIIFVGQPVGNAPDLSLSFGKGPARGTSAPASPAKSRESLLQRVQSLTGAARDQGASIIGERRFASVSRNEYFIIFVL